MKRLEIDSRPGASNPILLVALVAVSIVLTTVWYREGASGPLHVARSAVLAASHPFEVAGSAVTSPLRAAADFMSGTAVSRTEYETLRKQNATLKARLADLEEARLENERIRALVDFAKAEDLKTVGARIIGRPVDAWDGSIVIDRGVGAGVKVGMPVVAAGGLVGQVVSVTPFNSKVRLITSADSGVAVMVQRTRATGVVRGSIERELSLDFVDKSALPVRGDVLLTSGLGGVYPKGLVVGEVTDVAAPQADLFPHVRVTSRIETDRIEEVLVLLEDTSTTNTGGGE